MMALWAMCATAQPRVTDNGFIKMPSPHPVLTKTLESKALSSATPKRANKAKAGEVEHQVDFVLDFNAKKQLAWYIVLVNDEYLIQSDVDYGLNLVNGSNVMAIPEGTYDIYVRFQNVDLQQEFYVLNDLFVFREQVTIDQDMQLNFAASEAKNHIHFETLTPDGEPVNMGKWAVDDNYENWTELEPHNTDAFFYQQNVYCEDYGWLLANYGNLEVTIEEGPHIRTGHEFLGDFFVNDVSERYTFYTHRVGISGHDVFSTACEVQGASGSVTLTNDPSEYTLFPDPMTDPKHSDDELYQSVEFYTTLEYEVDPPGRIYSYTISTPITDNCNYYLGASLEDSQVGYMPFLEPSVGKLITDVTPWGWVAQQYVPTLVSMRLTKNNGEIIFGNNGVASVGTKSFSSIPPPSFEFEYNELLGRTVRYPLWSTFNPAFSYSMEKKKENLGNNCPTIGAVVGLNEALGERNLMFDRDYIGRYGEKKSEDKEEALVEIYADGELITSLKGTTIGFSLQPSQLTSGDMDINITNSNEAVTVDDLPCSNKAQIHFTIGNEDQFAPTTTMLHFKDANGDITDRFANANAGSLEFSAGDFNESTVAYDYSGGYSGYTHAYNRQAPESVEVSYSPYGEDNWNELPVEEVPENYWPVMGWFYTGSLASVTGEGLNGWFDLKIRLTDAAGNWQEQVISPAFRIDDHAYSSVASVGSSNAHEVARYNLAGQRVDSTATGVVIIKMSDGTAHKVLVK